MRGPERFFDVMCAVYAHHGDSIGRLYHKTDGSNLGTLCFYVPQLGNFLLHGSYFLLVQLECFIVDKSERSIHFAHRIFWFLRAFGFNVMYKSEICASLPPPGSIALNISGEQESKSLVHASSSVKPEKGALSLLREIENYGAHAASLFDAAARGHTVTNNEGNMINLKPALNMSPPLTVSTPSPPPL